MLTLDPAAMNRRDLRRYTLFNVSTLIGQWLLGTLGVITSAHAHNLAGDHRHSQYDWSILPPTAPVIIRKVARAEPTPSPPARAEPADRRTRPVQANAFAGFAPRVNLRWDDAFLYVESNGLPTHGMMTGITAWQQQVPLPQPYRDANAWRIPRHPTPAETPALIKNRFLRGAIALAVNGIPIFNPQNNRGELAQEIGELDAWGGHCGRADDYHYHAAPFHLQSSVGWDQPIAYALDGYPLYGLTEPDGSAPAGLDSCNGHETAALGYHYHGSTRYPYVNGGFHGIVSEREGQVDPQPRATSVRPALPALRGAKITAFTASPDETRFDLRYTVNGQPAAVVYTQAEAGSWRFQFARPDGTASEEIYRAEQRGGRGSGSGGGGPKGGPDSKRKSAKNSYEVRPSLEKPRPAEEAATPESTKSGFVLRSSAIGANGVLPIEFTGDGNSTTPPLEWGGAPAGTQSYAVTMHHIDPEGKTKWYWTLYNIPPSVVGLEKNSSGIGTLGNNSVNRRRGYAPPQSKGPGAKIYVLTAYALSSPVTFSVPPEEVSRELLLQAMAGRVLDQAELPVNYTRAVGSSENTGGKGPTPKGPRPEATKKRGPQP